MRVETSPFIIEHKIKNHFQNLSYMKTLVHVESASEVVGYLKETPGSLCTTDKNNVYRGYCK